MTASLLEIIEIASGEFVLQRVGGEGEPLVKIRFSDESRYYLADARLEIAKVMIQAGIQAAAQMSGGDADLDFVGDAEDAGHILH